MTKHFLALILTLVVIFSSGEQTQASTLFAETTKEIENLLPPNPCWREAENRYIHAGLTDFVCNRCDEKVEPRYGFSEDDIYILAQLLCGDESYDGDGEYDFVYGALYDDMNNYEMSKVLCVVMNRVRNDDFPDTVSDVIFQPGQFADYARINTKPANIAIEKIGEWCNAYDEWDPGVQSIPENHLYFEAGPNLTNITGKSWR